MTARPAAAAALARLATSVSLAAISFATSGHFDYYLVIIHVKKKKIIINMDKYMDKYMDK